MRLEGERVRAFANASGDHNPLHVDPDFARRSPWGTTIAHGALLVIAAFGRLTDNELDSLSTVSARFRRPVDTSGSAPLDLAVHRSDDRVLIELRHAGQIAASVTCTRATDIYSRRTGAWEELVYVPNYPLLKAVAADLGAKRVPHQWLAWLAGTSWFVGMHVPGRLGLLANLTIRADGPPVAERQVLARVDSEDDRTGLVELSMQWHGPEGSAAIEIDAFRRVAVPEPTTQSLAEYLDFEPVLADARIAVVGGSRGLGAAIVGACAMSGATVWAGYHRSADQVRRLRAEFGTDRVRPWPCDVTDPAHTAKAAARLQTEADVLNGLVLCATPPLWPTEPLPEAMTHLLNYLESAIRMVVSPLLCLNSLLRPNSGWITYISSSAVERPPRGWAHYTTGKVAAEHFCIELAQSASRPLLLLRPPRMHTDLTDSPTAKLNALPTEQVAARMVHWATAPPPGTTLSRL